MNKNMAGGLVLAAALLGLAIGMAALLPMVPPAQAHDKDPCASGRDNNCTGTPTPGPTCPPAWSVVTVPLADVQDNLFTAVAGADSHDVWAVGWFANTQQAGAPHKMLIEHWNGVAWQGVGSPNVGGAVNELAGVATLAADNAWAVGNYVVPSGARHTLVVQWDGINWSLVPSPDGNAPNSVLTGIAALGPTDIWAVGATSDANITHTLVEHWDGTRWAVIPSPDNAGGGALEGIAALAPDNIWAVGAGADSLGSGQALIEHWDGATWQVIPGPPATRLAAVAGAAANDVWAVGQAPAGGLLITHWDGMSWRLVPTAISGALYGITARAAHDVWAGGSVTDATGKTQPLVLHWDGTAWQVVPSPDPAAVQTSRIAGLAALDTQDVWAVGRRDLRKASAWIPLADHYVARSGNGCGAVTVTPTATSTVTPCPLTFSDVPPTAYFAGAVRALACRHILAGYADGTFRPYNHTTRGQLAKIVVLAAGWPVLTPRRSHFSDVPPDSPFYSVIETAYAQGILSGYADGTFRPAAASTRGQLTKLVVGAQHWPLQTPATPHFADVPPDSPFYGPVETAYAHGIISGYADGNFLPGGTATRGQIAAIIYRIPTAR